VRDKSARSEQGACTCSVATPHEHIEINKSAEFEVAVDLKRQRWSLVSYGGDAVTLEILEHAAQFSDEYEIARCVALVAIAYFL
jgi:hypothetical protein